MSYEKVGIKLLALSVYIMLFSISVLFITMGSYSNIHDGTIKTTWLHINQVLSSDAVLAPATTNQLKQISKK